MSVQWIAHVFEKVPQTITGSDRMVLLVLANYANDDGVCWPSVARVAHDAALSVRRTQDALRRLEAAGWVTRKLNQQPMNIKGGARTADRRTNLYCLSSGVDESSTPDPNGVDDQRDDGVDDHDATGWTDRLPEPSVEPSVDQPSVEQRGRTADAALPSRVEGSEFLPAARALCEQMAASLERRGERASHKAKAAAWVRPMEAILRIDGRSPDDVAKVLRWLDEGSDPVSAWWQPNVRSPGKLREKWHTMGEQYAREVKGAGKRNGADSVHDAVARWRKANA